MTTSNRVIRFLTASALLFTVSFGVGAYEVHVLTGPGSESKLLDKGDFQVAIKRLERRVQDETQNSHIQLTNLCTAYVASGALEQAVEICDRAVSANGDFVGAAYNSRGALKAVKGDYIGALADFEQAANKSNYPIPRVNFGDKAPSMNRFRSPSTEVNNSIELAARNHELADRRWAAIQQEEADELTADVN